MDSKVTKKRVFKKNKTLKKTKKMIGSDNNGLYTYDKTLPFKFTKSRIESAAKMANKLIGKKVLNPTEFYNTFVTSMDVYFNQTKDLQNDLIELKTTGKSHGRKLHWTLWKIQPNYIFSLHEHPNIEYAYVIDGEFYEKRLDTSIRKQTDLSKTNDTDWIYRTSIKNDVIINYPGIVHIDMIKGNRPSYVLILWSGSELHYTSNQYPRNIKMFVEKNTVKN